jgi:hypothetical protein
MEDAAREVTTPCPRCGQPFVLAVGRSSEGHEVDVAGFSCDCDLTEDEYEDMCDRAVATAEAEWDTLPREVVPPPDPRPWWQRIFGKG